MNRAWRRLFHAGNQSRGLFLLLALGCGQAAVWILGLPPGEGTAGFAWRAAGLFALQLLAIAVAWRRTDRAALWLVVGFAVLFRVAACMWPPDLSSDLYRYVWDGRVQLSGHSPYLGPPADDRLAELRDEAIWPNINRPEAVTVYPPGAQIVFLTFAAGGGETVWDVKQAAMLAELLALLLLVRVLRRRCLPIGHLIIYAWSPIIIAETAVSGHLDALVLPIILGAFVALGSGRARLGGGLIGAAAALKLYPILLLAAFPRKRLFAAAATAAGVLSLCYAPYAALSGTGVLGFLPKYVGAGEDFNTGLRTLLQEVFGPVLGLPHARQLAMGVCGVLLLGFLGYVFRHRGTDPMWKAGAITLAFVLLLPTPVHPWYAIWMAPFLVLHPAWAGIWLLGTLPMSYLKYAAASEVMPLWILLVEWVPAYLLVLVAAVRARRSSTTSTRA